MPRNTQFAHLELSRSASPTRTRRPSESNLSQDHITHNANSLQHVIENPTPDTLTPKTIMDVQRFYGNRFAQTLVQRATHNTTQGSNSAVQRYTDQGEAATREGRSEATIDWAKKYQRASAGGGIIQIAEQKIFARNDIIETSEAQLAKQGSFLQLVAEAGAPYTGYSWVRVKFRGATERQKNDTDVRNLSTENAKSPTERRTGLLAAIDGLMEANALEDDPGKVAGAKDANKSMSAEKDKLTGLSLRVKSG